LEMCTIQRQKSQPVLYFFGVLRLYTPWSELQQIAKRVRLKGWLIQKNISLVFFFHLRNLAFSNIIKCECTLIFILYFISLS
jgi:hypothetical protein